MITPLRIGELELVIDAAYSRHRDIIGELRDEITRRFAGLDTRYELTLREISVEHHCIRARFLLLISLLSPAAASSFIQDYPKLKEGMREIVNDVQQSYSYLRRHMLLFDRVYGPVKEGENLSSILMILGVPERHMNDAIKTAVKLNPDAFIDGNPDLLKEGAFLRIP